MKPNPDYLIWLDLEMTGLDLEKNRIIEIAVVVTDNQLEIIAESPSIAIHQPDDCILKMDEWCTKQHTRSGLVKRVQDSTIDEATAETMILEFIMLYVPPNKSPMCGNSICMDRRFLHKYMPKLEQYFHYRNLDVSTVKELARYWMPEIAKQFKKKTQHLAMDDIKESIDELRHYKNTFFKLENEKVTMQG